MQVLLILCLFLFSLALGSLSDVLYIEKSNADEAQLLVAKDFAGLADIFTKNVTYNAGDPFPTVHRIDSIQAILAQRLGQNITQYAISTQSITLLPPFDEQGAADAATGVVYTTLANIGQGNLTGEALIIFGNVMGQRQ